MAEHFQSGHIIDAILLLMAVETVLLVLYRRATGSGPEAFGLIANMIAGAATMLALRFALTGGEWQQIAVMLTVSLVAHVADVARRWRE